MTKFLKHKNLFIYIFATLALTHAIKAFAPENPHWTIMGMGGGGSTFDPVISYHDPDVFILRCDMSGTYLTRDGGQSYQLISFESIAVSYAFDPNQRDVIYAASAGIQRSEDGGKSWQRIFPYEAAIAEEGYLGDHAEYYIYFKDGHYPEITQTSLRFQSMKVDPHNSRVIYGGTHKAFFISKDYGKTWQATKLADPIDFIYTNRTDLTDEVLIFTTMGLYRMDKKSGEMEYTAYPEAMQPAVSFTGGTFRGSDSAHFYAVHSNDTEFNLDGRSTHEEIWMSADAGKSWDRIEHPLVYNPEALTGFPCLSASEFNANYVYASVEFYRERGVNGKDQIWHGVISSTDAGKTWDWVQKSGGGSGEYAVQDGQNARNMKGGWVDEAFGLELVRVIDIAAAPHNGHIAVGTDWYRVFRTENAGKSWYEVYSELFPDGRTRSRGMDVTIPHGIHFNPFLPEHIAASYTDVGYQHTFDGGKTWIKSSKGVPQLMSNTCYWVQFDPDVEGKLWGAWSSQHDYPRPRMTRNPHWRERARGGVAVSVDYGRTWRMLFDGMGEDSPSTSIVLDPRSPIDSRTLYATAYNKGVYKSTDGGESWKLKIDGIDPERTNFYQLLLGEKGSLFLVTTPGPVFEDGKMTREFFHGHVYRSDDGAKTWQRLHVHDKVGFPNSILEDPHQPGRLYLAAWSKLVLGDITGRAFALRTGENDVIDFKGGGWVSEDNGDTWRPILDTELYTFSLTPDPRHEGRIYAGTFNHVLLVSEDFGENWSEMPGYDFHWGKRTFPDPHHPENIYFTTFGSSIWYGPYEK